MDDVWLDKNLRLRHDDGSFAKPLCRGGCGMEHPDFRGYVRDAYIEPEEYFLWVCRPCEERADLDHYEMIEEMQEAGLLLIERV